MHGWSETLTAWRPVLTQAGMWLSWASMALGLAVAARLFHGGLHRTYPVLTAYLLFDVVRSVPAMLVSRTARGYWFLATEPVLWVLYFLLVREIFLAVLSDHRGIRTVGLRAVRWAAIVAVAGSALLLAWEGAGRASGNLWLQSAFVLGRAATCAILLLLALITGFLNWFPVSISPNTRSLVIGYALLFLFKTVALFARNIAGNEFTVLASVVNLSAMNLVLAWWAMTLTAANQRRPDPPRMRDGETERLMLQLDRINAALENAGSRR